MILFCFNFDLNIKYTILLQGEVVYTDDILKRDDYYCNREGISEDPIIESFLSSLLKMILIHLALMLHGTMERKRS